MSTMKSCKLGFWLSLRDWHTSHPQCQERRKTTAVLINHSEKGFACNCRFFSGWWFAGYLIKKNIRTRLAHVQQTKLPSHKFESNVAVTFWNVVVTNANQMQHIHHQMTLLEATSHTPFCSCQSDHGPQEIGMVLPLANTTMHCLHTGSIIYIYQEQ